MGRRADRPSATSLGAAAHLHGLVADGRRARRERLPGGNGGAAARPLGRERRDRPQHAVRKRAATCNELGAENGIAGVALVMLFALAVLRASRREQPIRAVQVRLGPHEPPSEDLHSFELPEWRAALREHPFIRCGLAGGVAAALAQSLVDFGLHMPANFLALMVVVALLVLSGRSQRAGGTGALGLLLVLLVAAAGPQLANSARLLAGAAPVSSRDCLEKADLVLAED